MQSYLDRFTEAWDPENGIEEEYWPDKDVMHCWRTMRTSMKSSVVHLDLAINGAGAIVKGILGISDTPKASKESSGESAAADEVAPENGEKVKSEGAAEPSSVAIKQERIESLTHSADGDAPPLKRAGSSDIRIKEEAIEV